MTRGCARDRSRGGDVEPNLARFAVQFGDSLAQFQEFLAVPLDGSTPSKVEVAPYSINTGSAVICTWDTSETPSGITSNGEVTEEYPRLN